MSIFTPMTEREWLRLRSPQPVEFRGYWSDHRDIGHDWAPWDVWWRAEIHDPNEVKDFRRGWVREVRMSDGSLVVVRAKPPQKRVEQPVSMLWGRLSHGR